MDHGIQMEMNNYQIELRNLIFKLLSPNNIWVDIAPTIRRLALEHHIQTLQRPLT